MDVAEVATREKLGQSTLYSLSRFIRGGVFNFLLNLDEQGARTKRASLDSEQQATFDLFSYFVYLWS